MKFKQRSLSESVWFIVVDGRIDQLSTPELEDTFNKALEAGHIRLVIDLAGVNYINSGGLRSLLTIRRQARARGGDVVMINFTSQLTQLFAVMGFDNVFRILPDQEAALKVLSGD